MYPLPIRSVVFLYSKQNTPEFLKNQPSPGIAAIPLTDLTIMLKRHILSRLTRLPAGHSEGMSRQRFASMQEHAVSIFRQ
jgi:hypothetical protein